MNLNSKSTLAKLLARENITVQHGNFRTAFFDVNSRILGLPLWKDRGRDVYDLLVGHEVGHALFTPPEGWHDAGDFHNIPKDYLNVVEDIRIERMIQSQYPGLVACFKRGYRVLNDEDFFAINGKDVNRMHFMNRLNLKAKLRELINIQFTDEEQEYVDLAMSVETWEDVVEVCKKLHAYMTKLQNENRVNPPSVEQDAESPLAASASPTEDNTEGSDTSEKNDQNGDSQKSEGRQGDNEDGAKDQQQESNDAQNGSAVDEDGASDEAKGSQAASGSPSGGEEGRDESPATVETSSNSEKDEKKERTRVTVPGGEGGDGYSSDINSIETDKAFRGNEHKLLDVDEYGQQPLVVRGINANQLDDMLIPFETLKAARAAKASLFSDLSYFDVTDQYRDFMTETEKFVNLMAKEFEMRKAAFQYSRSQSARSGSLDVTKLYNYKFSDDIFRRVTKLADAKNHGMIMLVDYSGSMHSVMPDVIKQILTLAMFCKKVNIPFEVFGFTNMDLKKTDWKHVPIVNDIIHPGVVITTQLSSSLNKRDYELAFRQLFNQAHETGRSMMGRGPSSSDYDELGGTPLNEVLTAMPHLIEKFKARHNTEKTILTILTDGEAQHMNVMTSYEVRSATRGISLQVHGVGNIKVNKERQLTPALVDALRKKCGVITLGYFLADSRYAFNGAIGRATGSWDYQVFAAARKAVTTQKFVSYSNAAGYDKYFVLRVDGRALDTSTDEFSVSENAKASDIRRAFKKFTTSKKLNRVLASQFAEAIS